MLKNFRSFKSYLKSYVVAKYIFNPSNGNSTKWSNTLKQFVGFCRPSLTRVKDMACFIIFSFLFSFFPMKIICIAKLVVNPLMPSGNKKVTHT